MDMRMAGVADPTATVLPRQVDTYHMDGCWGWRRAYLEEFSPARHEEGGFEEPEQDEDEEEDEDLHLMQRHTSQLGVPGQQAQSHDGD